MARQLSIARKFNLAPVGEGWDECYISYRPLTPRDLLAIKDLDPKKLDDESGFSFMLNFLKEHVVGGQVLAEDGLAALEPDDLDGLPTDIVLEFFAYISGGKFDPKDTPTTQLPNSVPTNASNS